MSRKHLIPSALCLLMLLACSGGTDGAPASATEAPAVGSATAADVAAGASELPLPDVPLTLQEPAERAAYVLAHFWDAMDFGDTLRALNRPFMEQAFANFVSILPYADGPARRDAVAALLTAAAVDSAAYATVVDIAEHYLDDPNSPMRSEEDYLLFLEHITTSPPTAFALPLERYRYQLEDARKNRPGMPAADFAFVTRAGQASSLHAEVRALANLKPSGAAEGRLLLVFYDPDCDHCREVMAALQADAPLARRVAEGALAVVAVYSGEDRALWERTAPALPAAWTVGYESGALQDEGRYVLRALPTLYLIGADGRVVLKDCNPQDL